MELSSTDISAVLRLAREVCDRWDDPAGWRDRLLAGACALLEGDVGTMIAEYGDRREGAFGQLAVVATVGAPKELQAFVQPAIAQFDLTSYADETPGKGDPGFDELFGQVVRAGWVTRQRSAETDHAARGAGIHYHRYRAKLDTDDYVVSIRLVDVTRRAEGISVDRLRGRPVFGPREVAILKLLHDEIAPLIGYRLATEQHLSRDGLSGRLRETLNFLLEGRSEKEAARAMKLSERTVHEYVTTLYRHFNVSTRAQLLAYFVRRVPTPRLPVRTN